MDTPYNPAATAVKAVVGRLWPSECLACGREGGWLCGGCKSRLVAIKTPTCPFCRRLAARGRTCPRCRRTFALTGARAVWLYREPIKSVIRRFKYHGLTAISGELGGHLATIVRDSAIRFSLVTSVPSAPKQWRDRGFNQSELLARAVASDLGRPYRRLLRRRGQRGQVGLTRRQRFLNVASQFVAQTKLSGEAILLVDDVITTGATLNACASALKSAGGGAVWAATVAKD